MKYVDGIPPEHQNDSGSSPPRTPLMIDLSGLGKPGAEVLLDNQALQCIRCIYLSRFQIEGLSLSSFVCVVLRYRGIFDP